MTVLDTIIAAKRLEVAERKSSITEPELEKAAGFDRKTISLVGKIQADKKPAIITEFKRKSPSKGIINSEAGVGEVVKAYAAYGAAAASVLTDESFFGGSMNDLAEARQAVEIPLLRKDFMIDPYQITEARAGGADLILLIAACLSPAEVRSMAIKARSLGLETLLEIHAEEELEHICDEVSLVGVNNRNLKTFEVDLEQSIRLAEKIGPSKIRIAESGIQSVEDILNLQAQGFDGFLIGERFMKEADPGAAFHAFAQKLGLCD